VTRTGSDADATETCELFGKYELLDRIATGGMAEIFRAVSASIDGFRKHVALKRILPHLSEDAEFVSLFIAEAKLAVSLTHSNIVQVLDFGRVETCYYMAMELVDGRDLTQLLVKQSRRKKFVPIDVACFLLSEILLGLEFAHTRRSPGGESLGIVHRDVSPHNLLVSYDGEVKLTDFGIAKAKTHVSLTKPGVIFGKFAYMSPEQASGLEVDARSDVYAAGITLYETLTGRRLFWAEDPMRTLEKVRHPKVSPPSRYNPEITRELDQIVLTALASDRDRRYQSCRQFAAALQEQLHRTSPGFNHFRVAHLMKELFEEEVGAAKFPLAEPPPKPRAATDAPTETGRPATVVGAVLEDPVLVAQWERFKQVPSLWTVVEMAAHFVRMKRPDLARITYRVAAAKFAQNGLLVQAIALYVQLREMEGWSEGLAKEVMALQGLAGAENEKLALDTALSTAEEIRPLLVNVLFASEPSGLATALVSPLFSFLKPGELANLVAILKLKRVPPTTAILREGEPGNSLYIITKGRVLIYCRNFQGQKVYLQSLSDGDCIGEFSFFTGGRRAATVESLDEVLLFEIDQEDFDTVIERFPSLTQALLQFYKERVVATLLAKSELFGVLPPKVRASLVERFRLEPYDRGAVVIREGEASDSFYLVKSGEVEVFREGGGYVFLSKLRSGDFFGEMAAITRRPRSASVRALGPVELLSMSNDDLAALTRSFPELTRVLESRITQREAENARRLTAGGQLV
jgi:serine/threonine-protein kinase